MTMSYYTDELRCTTALQLINGDAVKAFTRINGDAFCCLFVPLAEFYLLRSHKNVTVTGMT